MSERYGERSEVFLLTKIEREMRAVPAEKKAVNIQSDSVEV